MKKDVYKYYMSQINSYNSLKKQLEDMSAVKEVNQSAFEYISTLTSTMEANVARLSYIMYLLKMPVLGKTRKAYEGKYGALSTLFEKFEASEDAVKRDNDKVMDAVIKFMESLPDKVTAEPEDKLKKKKASSNKQRAIKRKVKKEA